MAGPILIGTKDWQALGLAFAGFGLLVLIDFQLGKRIPRFRNALLLLMVVALAITTILFVFW